MSDFLIIGGGIIGLLTAYELQKRGASVTLLEANRFGQEASWAGGGIISPLYPWRYSDFITTLAKHSQSLYPALVEQLQAKSGIDCELEKSGMLLLDPQEIIPATAWAAQHAIPMQVVDKPQVDHLAINAKALWMPEVMQVRNPRLLKALVACLQNSQVHLHAHQRVLKLDAQRDRIHSVHTQDKTFTADHIIITAGAWSGGLLSSLPIKPDENTLNIGPVKGQMLAFQTPPGLLKHMVLYHNHYLIPRRDGLLIAGSTMEYHAGFNCLPTNEARTTLYQAAIELCPLLKNYPIQAQWAGLRPFYSQGLPVIGRVEPYVNLSINAGHFRNGLVLAPGSVDYYLRHFQPN